DVGRLSVESTSLGGYWTHVGPGGWYTDTVLMGSALRADAQSSQFLGVKPNGSAVTASAEGGIPIAISDSLTLEPQAQLIWQRLSIDDANDFVSSVRFDSGNSFMTRLGLRLQGRFDNAGIRWQPYVRLSVLRASGSDDTVTFAGVTDIGTLVGQTSAQLGAGIVAKLNATTSAYVTANWVTNLDGVRQRVLTGNAGVRWTW
ncbi:autotransporter domain-containing protein, partial [Variovorax saccharolyticus]|uniref:autotransporter domain-containing protein n=1 Tax=Variovorax saccharolyticus TaxID=3053516 RepID=UPI00257657EC